MVFLHLGGCMGSGRAYGHQFRLLVPKACPWAAWHTYKLGLGASGSLVRSLTSLDWAPRDFDLDPDAQCG